MGYSHGRLGAGPTLDASGNLVLSLPSLRADVTAEYLRHGIIIEPTDPNDVAGFWANAMMTGNTSWSEFASQVQNAFGTWWPDTVAMVIATQGFTPGLSQGLTAVSTTASPGTMSTNASGPLTATVVPTSTAIVTTPSGGAVDSMETNLTLNTSPIVIRKPPRWLVLALGGAVALYLLTEN